jgi:hypothetical protein
VTRRLRRSLENSCTRCPAGGECDSGQEAKRIRSALVSAGFVELALFTMT